MALEPTANMANMNVVQFRIERGDSVVGTDGLLGRVEQIVVERETRQLRSLIVRASDSVREIEIPANLIARTLEHQVELGIGGADLMRHPELVTPYDPSEYVPIYEASHVADATAGRTSAETDRPVVTDVESDAAELVSARTEIAPEGDIESISMDDSVIPANATAPITSGDGRAAAATPPDVIIHPTPASEDRVVEPPQIVPAEATPPAAQAAPSASPSEDLMAQEAPPTPTNRQLPPEGETSPSEVSASEVGAISSQAQPDMGVGDLDEVDDIELTEQIEPFFVTEEDLAPTTGVPWGPILAVLGLTAVGMASVAGVVLWRSRERAKRKAAVKATGLALRAGGWRMTRGALRDAGERVEDAFGAVRDGAEHTKDVLTDALNVPAERMRWFQRGARTGRQVEAKKKAADLARITVGERLARARANTAASLAQAKANAQGSLRDSLKDSLARRRAGNNDDAVADGWYAQLPLVDATDAEELDIHEAGSRVPSRRTWLVFRANRVPD